MKIRYKIYLLVLFLIIMCSCDNNCIRYSSTPNIQHNSKPGKEQSVALPKDKSYLKRDSLFDKVYKEAEHLVHLLEYHI